MELAETLMPPTPGKLWGARDVGRELFRVGLKRGRGPVSEVVTREPRLDRLPVLTTWPEDGGPFVTLPLVYTEHPDGKGHKPRDVPDARPRRAHDGGCTGRSARGAASTTRLPRGATRRCRSRFSSAGRRPLILSAIAPLPENVPELMLASLIAGGRLKVDRATAPLPLVGEAEFALVGKVPPHRRRPEGPFGDHYGYYSLEHDYRCSRSS